jgi:hypothetical protein
MNKLYNSNSREGIERHRGAHSFLVFATAVQPSFLPANNGSGCIGCGGCCPPPKKLIFKKELIERIKREDNNISFKSKDNTVVPPWNAVQDLCGVGLCWGVVSAI